MADFGSPVAQGVNVNPAQGIQTISGILGLKQQAQTLETGKALQASAKAEAATRGIEAQGKTEAAGFLKDFDFFDHIGPDGTLDLNAVYTNPKFQNAGPGKDLIANAMLGIKKGQIENKQNMANLQGTVVNAAGQLIGALADDPDVKAGNEKGFAKTKAQWDVFKEMFPDQGQALAGMFEPHMNSETMKPEDLSRAVRTVQLQATDVSNQRAQQKPVLGTAFGPGGQAIGTSQDQNSAVLSAPSQPGVQVGLGPTETPAYRGQVASATARATGVGGIDVDRATAISAGQQPANAAIGLTQRVDDLADQIQSGHFAKWVVERAAAAGSKDPSVTARQLLEKDLGQLKTAASARAESDAKMGTILSGYPESTSTPDTIHGAMDYIRGSFRQQLARGKLLSDYQKKHPDLAGFQHADDMFTSSVDPMMAEYKQLTTPEQRIGFYKRNFKNAADAAAFKAKVQGLSHVLER